MNHADVRNRLADYLDGQLGLEQRALFDAHLDQCERCAREVAELRAAVTLLRSLPDPEPPADLVGKVMSRVRAAQARPSLVGRARDWLASLTPPSLALPAAAAAAGLLVAVVSGTLPVARPGGPTAVAPGPELALEQAAPEVEVADASPAPVDAGAPPDPLLDALRATRELSREIARARSESQSPSGLAFRSLAELRSGSPSGPSGRAPALIGASSAEEVASSAADSGDAATREERRHAELDRRIDFLLDRPADFAADFQELTLAEQELWTRQLARRALERGMSDDVLEALRESSDPSAVSLSTAFDAALRAEQ